MGGGVDQLTDADRAGPQRVVARRAADPLQSRGAGQFDHGGVSVQAPACRYEPSQCVVDQRRLVATTQRRERPLATVGERTLRRVPPTLARRAGHRVGDLRRGRGATELVGGGEQPGHWR
jgi:hypothetical protein